MTIAASTAPPGRLPKPACHRSPIGDEIDWLVGLLGASGRTPPIPYLGRPSLDDLQFLVPTEPRPAAVAALRRFDEGRSRATRTAGLLGRGAARLGFLRHGPGQRLTLPPFELVDRLATALGEPELVAAVTIGRRRRNRKPVLQLITASGRTVGFAKVGWSPLTTELVDSEAAVLRLVEGRLPSGLEAPTVLLDLPWRDGLVVVTTPLQPPVALERLLATPLSVGAGSALDTIGLVEAIAACDPGGYRRVADLALFEEWGRAGIGSLVDLGAVQRRHRHTVLDVGLWHGDLTPWNMLSAAGTVAIWDWEFAGSGRPVGFDLLHHLFEGYRRRRGGSNRTALTATVDQAADLLRPLLAKPGTAAMELDRSVAAIIDLYLCELIAREVRLGGQRWTGGAMAGLAPVAEGLLARRGAPSPSPNDQA